MADVKVDDQGSVVGFTPLTDDAKKWFEDNVQSEGWQWMGPTLWVDHRMAQNLSEGLFMEGLI